MPNLIFDVFYALGTPESQQECILRNFKFYEFFRFFIIFQSILRHTFLCQILKIQTSPSVDLNHFMCYSPHTYFPAKRMVKLYPTRRNFSQKTHISYDADNRKYALPGVLLSGSSTRGSFYPTSYFNLNISGAWRTPQLCSVS